MNLLITGTDQALGKLLCNAFGHKYNVRALGREDCDHRNGEAIAVQCQGMDVVLHCDVFDSGDESDERCLDWASRGTYVLMQAAMSAGVERVVLASSLSLFQSYPDGYVIDETWQPKPEASADSLAPYLAELTCREFARQGGISAIGLRFGEVDAEDGIATEDVIRAFDSAIHLELEPHGYRWQIFHISSSARFSTKNADRVLQLPKEGR